MDQVAKKLSAMIAIATLTSCASIPSMTDSCTKGLMKIMGECVEKPVVVHLPTHQELLELPAPKKQPIVAVYKFNDQTGQRKQKGDVAMFSTAVSQGSDTMLIYAVKTAGRGKWFRVVERQGIDNLVRERQIVRSTRQDVAKATGTEAQGVGPLLFAGMIIEGGIIGYDTNTETGGRGARTLGIGFSKM